jgi:molecular chaperone DnaJ
VTLVVATPERLSSEAKELLRKFDEITGNSLNQGKEETEKKSKKKGFMDKVKEVFED